MTAAVYWPETRTPYVQLTGGGVWKQLSVKYIVGNSAPTLALFRNNVYLHSFAGNASRDVDATFKVPNDWKVGTDIKVRVQWSVNVTSTGSVWWGLEYTTAPENGVFGATTLNSSTTSIATASQYKHFVSSLGTIPAASLDVNNMVVMRLYRNANDASDTFTGAAFLLDLVISYQADSIGSKTENAKLAFV
jgi:hypothetical protein